MEASSMHPSFSNATTTEELVQFAEFMIAQAMEEVKEDGSWTAHSLSEDMKVSVPELRMVTKNAPGAVGVRAVKVSGIIHCKPLRLFKFFSLMTEKVKKSIDYNLIECSNIREVSTDRYSATFPIYPREFIVMRVDRQIGDCFYLFSTSINYDSCPITSKYVRGDMKVSGLMVKPTESGTQLIKVVKIDPKGSIPAFLVNLVSYKQAEFFVTLNDLFTTK